jgi:hypothetical protein
MGCFDGIIGYKGCTTSDGILLDNLVPYSEVQKYVTADYEDASELIEEKIAFAIKNVTKEIGANFRDNYKPKTIIDSKRAGLFGETQTEKAASPEFRGIELEICNVDSYYSLYVSEIQTYLNYTGAVSLLVIDTMNGETLDTIAITSVAGELSTTYVNKTYNADKRRRRIAFVYDCTSIPNYLTTLLGDECSTCNKGLYNISNIIKGRSIRYATADTPILSNLEGHTDTAGLSLVFTLHCDNESWICTNRSLLELPLLNRVAELIMEFALFNSDRFNTDTAINKEQINARMMKYHEDYESQMKITLAGMISPSDGVCFVCNKRRKYVTSLP